jgi:metallo-beta-lactamase family protein
MNVSVHGAAGGEVTGSSYLVATRSARVLVDFGMFQGGRAADRLNRLPSAKEFRKLDAVVLTHAHLDHTGRLPLLARAGYRRRIWATAATHELTDLILRDSAHLQEADATRESRRRRRQGKPPVEPLYTIRDVEALHGLHQVLEYDRPIEVAEGVTVRGVEAGHILGSMSLEMTVEENGQRKVIVFSGDLGPRGAPLHRDPVPFRNADLVFMESTYGDREHRSLQDTAEETRQAIRRALAARGKILVPVFAVGRTQLLLYLLAGEFQRGTLPRFPVYLDSPMALEATKIYGRHPELYDEEAIRMHRSGDLREEMDDVHICASPEESRALNDRDGPMMILAGSGMCTGGRIVHHLRHNLAKPETAVFVVGYQAAGSLGRMLVEGKRSVPIFGERIPVRAAIHTVGGLSGHAGQGDLVRWYGSLAASHPRLQLTHGEDAARQTLSRLLAERFGVVAGLPALGETVTL